MLAYLDARSALQKLLIINELIPKVTKNIPSHQQKEEDWYINHASLIVMTCKQKKNRKCEFIMQIMITLIVDWLSDHTTGRFCNAISFKGLLFSTHYMNKIIHICADSGTSIILNTSLIKQRLIKQRLNLQHLKHKNFLY